MRTNSDHVFSIGQALIEELLEESPIYRSVLDGTVDRDVYIAFLVQHHKYIRFTHDLMSRYADAMGKSVNKAYRTTIRQGAQNHADEERGHDDGILTDLASLWECSLDRAREGVDAEETAPSLVLYEASLEAALVSFPCATAGLAAVLESVSTSLCARARAALLERRPWPGVEQALRFLSDHAEDGEHLEGGRLRMDLLEPGHDSDALIALARTTAVIYRELYRYLDGQRARGRLGSVETAPSAA